MTLNELSPVKYTILSNFKSLCDIFTSCIYTTVERSYNIIENISNSSIFYKFFSHHLQYYYKSNNPNSNLKYMVSSYFIS